MFPDFFAGCTTPTEVKSRYRHLAMQWHPDRGGDTATMQAINAQYKQVLARMDGTQETGTDNQPHTYHYNDAAEQAIIDKLAALLRSKLPGCDIWLIGKWIWVQGDTRPVRETLKANGLVWHAKRLAWYWHRPEDYSHYNARGDLASMAAKYGARHFAGADEEQPTA
jgi:hypothetical protein